jgi:hypothetical protein
MRGNKIINLRSFTETSSHLDVLGERYGTEVVPSKYFVSKYKELFNIYTIHAKVQIEDFLNQLFKRYKLTEDAFVHRHYHADDINIKEIAYSTSEFIIDVKDRILLSIENDNFKIYYGKKVKFMEIEKLLGLIEKSKESIDYKKKFFMVVANQNSEFGFELQQFDIQHINIDLQSNYNNDFLPIHTLINGFLNKDSENGLVLLHGKFGTGKTTYLRYLISTVNKRVIFLPLELIDTISSPGFLPFISQYRDSILILEDCEELLRPRESSSFKASGIANLLNLGDGLLADALSIKIICTFNAELKLIDKAILRKGRLVARYEFGELDAAKAQKLCKKMGLKAEITEPITLAEIFNYELQDFNINSGAEGRRLGF